MKLLYFSLDYTPHDHRFLSALAGTEHRVYYVRLQRGARQLEDRPLPPQIEQVPWTDAGEALRWRDLPRLVGGFRWLVRRIRPDLIHAGPIQSCAFIAVLSGFRPILTMSWGFDLLEDAHSSRWMEWITSYVLRHSTFFTSDAEVTRQKAIRYGMDPQRTIVFPWGVDLNRFHVPAFQHSNDSTLMLFCNRSWEPRYGVDVLARAFVRVAQQDPHVHLMLLGGGSQAQVIHRILREGGVWERVSMPGRISQNDLPRWYHRAHLFISPAHVDGSSVSLMEALACGLPCLVSDIPANREWIREGINGWLFPDGEAEALAARITTLIAQRETWPEIRRAARQCAEERADWRKNFSMLLTAYDRTLRLHKGSGQR